MRNKITRRDFLNGAVLSVAATALAPYSSVTFGTAGNGAISRGKDYYPPLLTGMRGSHKGSFEVAHALVMEGQRPEQYEPVDHIYDLVIVGGGISGLSAAYYLRRHGHSVTIYDAKPALGGMLRYGIPEYRLPKKTLDFEIQSIMKFFDVFEVVISSCNSRLVCDDN